jgi:hypothetical protein
LSAEPRGSYGSSQRSGTATRPQKRWISESDDFAAKSLELDY